ncbi:Predicted arabinose efflux permease, MFS family [Anaerovirgula multivorans]|uniref:Predicted arabinose efflux permease, MFS family n=1 Tax=Anaerovirgula multivorans TaxID=312168 RepID=A0A239C8I0_9FIRM|nr:MFS transporter [Anaerovirgula multivorans]SNS15754.1 Predicted arabinose efflux permease, MFS family [Anaerovirgula multivorans]
MMVEKKHDFFTKAAALSVALLMYTTSMTTPALGEIAKAFPDVSPEVIKQIASLPSLMMVVFSFLCGQLERFISPKKILYLAMTLTFVGGILPAFVGGMTFILFTRAIFGAGFGLSFPMSSSVVADLFEGQERDTLMGYRSAVGAMAGVVFQMVGGILASRYWRYSFLGFLLVIPIFLLIHFKLPDYDKKQNAITDEEVPKNRLSTNTYLFSIFNAFFNILQFSFMTNVALVMKAGEVGNAAQAGTVLTVFTAAAFVAGLIYGKVARIFKRFTISLAIGLIGASFFILLNVNTFPMFIVGAIVFGLGFGTYNPTLVLAIVRSAHKTASTIALSLYVALQGLGQFASPPILAFLTGIFGLTGPKAAWIVAAGIILSSCVISILVIGFTKPKIPETSPN